MSSLSEFLDMFALALGSFFVFYLVSHIKSYIKFHIILLTIIFFEIIFFKKLTNFIEFFFVGIGMIYLITLPPTISKIIYFYKNRAPKGYNNAFSHYKFESTDTVYSYLSVGYYKIHLDCEITFNKILRYFPFLLPKEVTDSLNELEKINQEFFVAYKKDIKDYFYHYNPYSYVENKIFQSSATKYWIKNDNFSPKHYVFMMFLFSIEYTIKSYSNSIYEKGEIHSIEKLFDWIMVKMSEEQFMNDTEISNEKIGFKNLLTEVKSWY